MFKEAMNDETECDVNKYELPKSDDLSEILFTTGTTGKSKGIKIICKNNIAIAQNVSEAIGKKRGERPERCFPKDGRRGGHSSIGKNGQGSRRKRLAFSYMTFSRTPSAKSYPFMTYRASDRCVKGWALPKNTFSER